MGNKVLVVVDYQNDFVTGALGFEDAVRLEKGIAKKIRDYHKDGNTVICTMDTHGTDYDSTEEGKNLPVVHCIEDSYGWELYGLVKDAAKECNAICLTKPTFPSEELVVTLKEMDKKSKAFGEDGITEVELCGVVTNMCVISNAVASKMALPNAHIKIIKELCSSFDMVMHQKALDVMQSMQMEIA